MLSLRPYIPSGLVIAAFLASLAGCLGSAKAQYTIGPTEQRALEYLKYKAFGDFDANYVLRGGTTPRYVNGERVAPHEGLFSPAMRRVAGTVHKNRKTKNANSNRLVGFTRFNALNLAVAVPEKGWEQLDPEEQGTQGCLLLSHTDPNIVISLAAKPVGIDAQETSSSLLASSQKKMRALPNGVVLPGVRKLSAPGLGGRAYQSTATFATGQQLHYSLWVATRNGYNYSLAVYGDSRQKQAIDSTMKQFVSRMRQIEPRRVASVIVRPTQLR